MCACAVLSGDLLKRCDVCLFFGFHAVFFSRLIYNYMHSVSFTSFCLAKSSFLFYLVEFGLTLWLKVGLRWVADINGNISRSLTQYWLDVKVFWPGYMKRNLLSQCIVIYGICLKLTSWEMLIFLYAVVIIFKLLMADGFYRFKVPSVLFKSFAL